MKTVRIDRQGDIYEIYDPNMPGMSGACGRGRTLMEAMGRYLHHGQNELGIEFEVTEEAQPFINEMV